MKFGQTSQGKLVLVLDTSAILRGFMRHMTDAIKFTTPDVLNELSNSSFDFVTNLHIVDEASIGIRAPNEMILRRVDQTAAEVGETSLSRTDRSLAALALELKDTGYDPVLVTDDYALQNVAEILGLAYKSYIERGIRRRYRWKLVCPGCLREYRPSPAVNVCSVCGSKLKRRIITSKKVRHERS
nr:DNA-binding protein [Candidatus Njordarchaeota archaeon]